MEYSLIFINQYHKYLNMNCIYLGSHMCVHATMCMQVWVSLSWTCGYTLSSGACVHNASISKLTTALDFFPYNKRMWKSPLTPATHVPAECNWKRHVEAESLACRHPQKSCRSQKGDKSKCQPPENTCRHCHSIPEASTVMKEDYIDPRMKRGK